MIHNLWIRPTENPPQPNAVGGLSSQGAKVLHALRVRFGNFAADTKETHVTNCATEPYAFLGRNPHQQIDKHSKESGNTLQVPSQPQLVELASLGSSCPLAETDNEDTIRWSSSMDQIMFKGTDNLSSNSEHPHDSLGYPATDPLLYNQRSSTSSQSVLCDGGPRRLRSPTSHENYSCNMFYSRSSSPSTFHDDGSHISCPLDEEEDSINELHTSHFVQCPITHEGRENESRSSEYEFNESNLTSAISTQGSSEEFADCGCSTQHILQGLQNDVEDMIHRHDLNEEMSPRNWTSGCTTDNEDDSISLFSDYSEGTLRGEKSHTLKNGEENLKLSAVTKYISQDWQNKRQEKMMGEKGTPSSIQKGLTQGQGKRKENDFHCSTSMNISAGNAFTSIFSLGDTSDFHGEKGSQKCDDQSLDVPLKTTVQNEAASCDIAQNDKPQRKYLGTPFKRACPSFMNPMVPAFTSSIQTPKDRKETSSLSHHEDWQQFQINESINSIKYNTSLTTDIIQPDRNITEDLCLTEPKNDLEEHSRCPVTPKSSSTSGPKIPRVNLNQTTLCFTTSPDEKYSPERGKRSSKLPDAGPVKKKLKFRAPFIKTTEKEYSMHTEEKNVSCGTDLHQLNEKTAQDLTEKLESKIPIELTLTIVFKRGFCQLNKPKSASECHPTGLYLQIMWESNIFDYVFVSLKNNALSSYSVLHTLLLSKIRKVCFGAQEMCQLLIDKFNFTRNEVSLQLLLLDPLVGCWLLNPDTPPGTFEDVLKVLKIDQRTLTDDIPQKLKILSISAKRLYEQLSLLGLWKLFLHIEMRITPILACMEIQGIAVDVQKLHRMATLLQMRLSVLQVQAHKAAGRVFQLTSPQQLSVILYDELKLDVKNNVKVKETIKRQNKSTSESMLLKLKDLHPLPSIVMKFRKVHKLLTTFVEAVLERVSGNRIFSTWQQTSVATGRIVSMDPNLQAIPKQPLQDSFHSEDETVLFLRDAYVARSGCTFVTADFQQIELRVFAHLSNDADLIKALNGSQDIFMVLARRWLGCGNEEDISQEDRDKTKRIVYALMYGAGPSKLVEFLQVSYEQACSILKSFTDTFVEMQDFVRKTSKACKQQGYLTTISGRRRWFPNIKSSNDILRQQSERQSVNFLIQGSAADICKCAMVQTQRRLAQSGMDARLLLQIHDELLWEVPDSCVTTVSDLVQSAMEEATKLLPNPVTFLVPLPVVVKKGKTWADMTTLKKTSVGQASQVEKT